MINNYLDLLPLFMLYPETHYKFKYFPFSLYNKKEPEILFDTPFRVEQNNNLPIFLLIKDSDKYPINIEKITIDIFTEKEIIFNYKENLHLNISQKWFSKTFQLKIDHQGIIKIKTTLEYSCNSITKYCTNDNFKQKTEFLYCYLNDSKINSNNDLIGDLHYHSNYTNDHVEYGAPIKETKICAKAIGLNYFAVTDHSYDLDDEEDSYLTQDPKFTKFYNMRRECLNLNQKQLPTTIPGEEITVRNNEGRNVHLLCLNYPTFWEGSGDDAEKWLQVNSEHSIKDVAKKYKKENDNLLIAAHPFVKTPLLEYLLIKRGEWKKIDLLESGINHWQILNGELDQGFYDGLKFWIKSLLNGHKIFISAGNDAHGNFSTFRQISFPMIKMVSERKQLFGRCKTVIPSKKTNSVINILQELKNGNCYISTGPCLNFAFTEIDNNKEQSIKYGNKIELKNINEFLLEAVSSNYFGNLTSLIIIGGFYNKCEKIIYEKKYKKNMIKDKIVIKASDLFTRKPDYIRVEVKSYNKIEDRIEILYSNAVWVYGK